MLEQWQARQDCPVCLHIPLSVFDTVTIELNSLRSDFDIGDSVQCLRYYAGWADKILGQVGFVFA